MRYTAIAEVSRQILELIQSETVPSLIEKADLIGLCSPDNSGDFRLGIYLYSIEESERFRLSGRKNVGLYHQKYPPIVLDLYYMITPYYKSDVKFLAEEEQTLLGRIVQILNDHSVLESQSEEPITLEFCNPSLDDRQKIWNSTAPYRTSVFFSARAVMVESAREKEISRVTDITIHAGQKGDMDGSHAY